eukprot:gene8098-16618_t
MEPLVHSLLSADIPSSLRPVSPFLSEAQRSLSCALEPSLLVVSNSRKKLAICCLNHAFKLLNILQVNIDDAARDALSNFAHIRDGLALELNIMADQLPSVSREPSRLKIQIAHAEDMLIAEADEILQLAEEQLAEGFQEDAANNFHTAAVYYRVLESMLPAMASELHGRLMFAASRTRQCSRLLENYIVEHFDGETCSEVYEVHGSSKLGKGSYDELAMREL